MQPSAPMLKGLAENLRRQRDAVGKLSVAAGFDGFVDEMISVVGERQSLGEFTPVPTIADLGDWVTRAAGRSSLREIVVHRQDPGGCAVNLADGLTALGVPVDLFGTLGDPMHPAFEPIVSRCRSYQAWSKVYGRTLAFEFTDGKLMFSSVSQLAELDAAMVQKELAGGAYQRACAEAGVIALTDWSLYPHMTEVWRTLQRQVFASLPKGARFFVDLVDPSSRGREPVREMLGVMKGFESAGPVTLGLNGNEANVLSRALDRPEADEQMEQVRRQATGLREAIGVAEVVIHCNHFAAQADAEGAKACAGPYCAKPRKSVGAGDRFNAGYCLGWMLGMDAAERLALGGAASGYFVREARSASIDDMAGLLERWAAGDTA